MVGWLCLGWLGVLVGWLRQTVFSEISKKFFKQFRGKPSANFSCAVALLPTLARWQLSGRFLWRSKDIQKPFKRPLKDIQKTLKKPSKDFQKTFTRPSKTFKRHSKGLHKTFKIHSKDIQKTFKSTANTGQVAAERSLLMALSPCDFSRGSCELGSYRRASTQREDTPWSGSGSLCFFCFLCFLFVFLWFSFCFKVCVFS